MNIFNSIKFHILNLNELEGVTSFSVHINVIDYIVKLFTLYSYSY